MFGILVINLMLIAGVMGSTLPWFDVITEPNTEIFTQNLTCNEAGSVCGHCFINRLYGSVHTNVFEYTKNPVKIRYTAVSPDRDINIIVIQDDLSEPFRFCDNTDTLVSTDLTGTYKGNLCMDNIFSEASLPTTCTKPVALVTYDVHFGDSRLRNEYILYCLPE